MLSLLFVCLCICYNFFFCSVYFLRLHCFPQFKEEEKKTKLIIINRLSAHRLKCYMYWFSTSTSSSSSICIVSQFQCSNLFSLFYYFIFFVSVFHFIFLSLQMRPGQFLDTNLQIKIYWLIEAIVIYLSNFRIFFFSFRFCCFYVCGFEIQWEKKCAILNYYYILIWLFSTKNIWTDCSIQLIVKPKKRKNVIFLVWELIISQFLFLFFCVLVGLIVVLKPCRS